MLEVQVSVRPESLTTSEGTLVSISIAVEPPALEALLEALAEVSFPINPEIYPDAAVVPRYRDGGEEFEATTLVESPAYASRVDEVRHAIAASGFDPSSMRVTGMLEELQSETHVRRRVVAGG